MRQIALIALLLALVGVSLAGLYFLGLAAVSFIAPASAQGFLLGFAGTASAPYLELTLRLAVGAAFVARAPLMMFPLTFGVFGWVLIVTSACLLASLGAGTSASRSKPFLTRCVGLTW